ncbi:MAG: hypothetical protein K8U57_16635 [Planctomycetes bacterium]|nr:hypothetical protein [Planctomycetota bacterium]
MRLTCHWRVFGPTKWVASIPQGFAVVIERPGGNAICELGPTATLSDSDN